MPGFVQAQGENFEVTQPYTKQGGSWLAASKAYTKQGGQWVEWWPGGGGEPPLFFEPGSYGLVLESRGRSNRWRVAAQDDVGVFFGDYGNGRIYRCDDRGNYTQWASDTGYISSYGMRAVGRNEVVVLRNPGAASKVFLNGAETGTFTFPTEGETFWFYPVNLQRTFYVITKTSGELWGRDMDASSTEKVSMTPPVPYGNAEGSYSNNTLFPCPSKGGFYMKLRNNLGNYESRFLTVSGEHTEVMPVSVVGSKPTVNSTGDAELAGCTHDGLPLFFSDTTRSYWTLDGGEFIELTLRPGATNSGPAHGGGAYLAGVPSAVVPTGVTVGETMLVSKTTYSGYDYQSAVSLLRTDPRWEVTSFETPPTTGYGSMASNGSGTTIFVANDGIHVAGEELTFTETLQSSDQYNNAYWDGNLFVALNGVSTRVALSNDGSTWVTPTTSRNASATYYRPVSGEGSHLVSARYTGVNILYRVSENWMDWEILSTPADDFEITSYGNGRWVGASGDTGAIYWSSDLGESWSEASGGSLLASSPIRCSGAYSFDKHFVSGYGGVMESTDGDNWVASAWQQTGTNFFVPELVGKSGVVLGGFTAYEAPKFSISGGRFWEPLPGVEGITLSNEENGLICILSVNDFVYSPRASSDTRYRARKL